MKHKTIYNLLQSCKNFEKLAELTDAEISKLIYTYKPALKNEVAAGIRAINRLFTQNENAAKSNALASLDDSFGRIGVIADGINPQSPKGTDISIRDMLSIAGAATFYTNSMNVGMGYDPITHIGGADSPAAHLNRIMDLLKKFDNLLK